MQRRLFFISLTLFSALCVALLLSSESYSQSTHKLSTKKQELRKLRGNIKLYEKKIAESSRQESVSLGALDRLERENLKTRQSIKGISNRMDDNSRRIDEVEGKISDAASRLSDLKAQYAEFAKGLYKQGRMHDLELILTASSVNEMLVRYEYLKKFSDQTRLDLSSITSEQEKLVNLKEELHQQLAKQQGYLGRKRSEERVLASRIIEHRRLIGKLRKNKKVYAEQLRRSRNAAEELERLIQGMIAAETHRRPASGLRGEGSATASRAVPQSLAAMRGHLPWPVSGGRVVATYGEHENPVLRTVTLNYGIDIAVPDNSEVKSVADGQVARIFWLPSYGNLIIINNYNGLRTVYSHLSDIFVKEGQRVTAGEPIGTVGESLGGSILHFEVWLNTKKQDPETWLSRR